MESQSRAHQVLISQTPQQAQPTPESNPDVGAQKVVDDNSIARPTLTHGVASLNLLRLDPTSPSAIPFHPDLSGFQDEGKCLPLPVFVSQALGQAQRFLAENIPTFDETRLKKSKGSASNVAVKTWTLEKDFWVARKSIHAGQGTEGDATWAEFDRYLKKNHSKNEMEYTPGVVDAVEVCRWSENSLEQVDGWTDVEMSAHEMKHQLPAPLKPRVFTILTISGVPASADRSFITLTLPLALPAAEPRTAVSSSKYSNSSAVVHGAYVSVEHVYVDPKSGNSEGPIVWIMATASNAKGSLPMAVQRLGIPPAITKDVGLMLKFAHDKRTAKV